MGGLGARRAATKTQLALTCKPFGGGVGLEAVLVDVVVYKTLADESASKIVFTEDVVLRLLLNHQ